MTAGAGLGSTVQSGWRPPPLALNLTDQRVTTLLITNSSVPHLHSVIRAFEDSPGTPHWHP